MFDEAEKKIARLIAESTTSGESKSGSGKIKVKGRGNIVALGDVTVTINLHASPKSTKSSKSQLFLTSAAVAPSDDDALELARGLILQRCEELGDPRLYVPFILSLFRTDRLEDLARAQLSRLELWLGLHKGPPK